MMTLYHKQVMQPSTFGTHGVVSVGNYNVFEGRLSGRVERPLPDEVDYLTQNWVSDRDTIVEAQLPDYEVGRDAWIRAPG